VLLGQMFEEGQRKLQGIGTEWYSSASGLC